MSVPNLLTLFRLASAPIFLALFIGSGEGGFLSAWLTPQAGLWTCLAVIVLSETSDILDGIIARKYNLVSNFGKILDPYADSTFRLSVYFSFASQAHGKWIPLWMVMILFYRDLLVTVIRNFGIEQGLYVAARASGKIKAVAQGGAAIAVLIIAAVKGSDWVAYQSRAGEYVSAMAHSLMWLVTGFTLWSAFDYTWGNRHLFRMENPPPLPAKPSSEK
ncbi:MAG: CDP-diacylglycerol--glycerol-3-phosphate 3-phosphatidyltransferase [Planctomycetota bacterium]|nr:CDP-diacylglycerol--glycerol-3-phosphate 3-phosphatidyltransferase [Planctomycetota bacterium]